MIPFSFKPPSREAREQAAARQAQLTKPPGSLGRLEEVALQLAANQGTSAPEVRPALVVLFGADHPVTKHGISPYPSAVTRAMMQNFVRGGAAASVLSKGLGLPLHVADVGVDDGTELRSLVPHVTFSRAATASVPEGDIVVEDAQPKEAFVASVESGRSIIRERVSGLKVLILGEMGIGNTTVAAAVAARLLELAEPGIIVGRGTGADDAMLEKKRRVFTDAVARVSGAHEPEELLRRLGGRELFALYGAMLGAVESGVTVLVDGFIVTTVALVLMKQHPETAPYFIFSHRGAEHGHNALLEATGARPLLSLDLRLGEASGALSAFPLLENAVLLHNRMATFEEASVPDRGE